MFSEKLMDHCQNPRNVGSLNEDDIDVGTGMVGSPVCGDMLRFQLRIKDNKIIEAKFKTFGCGGAIGSSSLMTEKIIGKSVEDALKVTNKELVEELELPAVKIHCSVMAQEAIAKAVDNYREKNKK